MSLLSHYLVYIGQKCLLLPPSWNEKIAIELAKSKQPAFIWKLTVNPNYMAPVARRVASKIMRVTKGARSPRWKDLIKCFENDDLMGTVSNLASGGLTHQTSNIGGEQSNPGDCIAPTLREQTMPAKGVPHGGVEQREAFAFTTPSTDEDPCQSEISQRPPSRIPLPVHHKVCLACSAATLVTNRSPHLVSNQLMMS